MIIIMMNVGYFGNTSNSNNNSSSSSSSSNSNSNSNKTTIVKGHQQS
jgi:hypothetical protein